ncbi:MAG: hypothetical protein MJ246_00140 [Clostridia bacterium]|nr:hypothetical protein [Clostridia bacterium]
MYVFNIAGSGSKILFDKSHCEVTQTVDRTTLQNIDYNAGDKIYIPINVSSSSDGEDRTYDIGIKFYPDEDKIDENGIESEVLKYNANADKNITIDVPTIIRTDNLSILTDKHEGEPDFGLVRTAQFRIT